MATESVELQQSTGPTNQEPPRVDAGASTAPPPATAPATAIATPAQSRPQGSSSPLHETVNINSPVERRSKLPACPFSHPPLASSSQFDSILDSATSKQANRPMGTYSVSTRSSHSSRAPPSRRRSRDLEAGRISDSGGENARPNGGAAAPATVAVEPGRRPSRLSLRHNTVATRRKRPIPVKDVPLGYSKLAAFIDLEDDLAIFRRFSRLHAQLLLYRQADIEEIEEEMKELDAIEAADAHMEGTPANVLNRSWRREKDLEEYRVELVKKLRKSMKLYDDELFRYKQKLNLKDAADWQIENVEIWMNNQRPHPLVPTESRFLEDRGDVASLKSGSEDSAVLTDALRSWARDSCSCLSWMFRKKGNPASYGDASITYYNTDVKDAFTRVSYATLVSVSLVAGVVALFYIESNEGRLACLCVATFLCGVILALFTTAKKGEIMGGTAAYCAVLVVFVGSTLSGGDGPMGNPPAVTKGG
ncbi:hypothetical protein Dda_1639 [Drechslerella dactyloides]|uniref:DUF6594 domain-containing protein n=1 Tax=Drechslerella dactyloides TaxID=74499 RepID=A0AAD6NM98_DREDA|nr:hypothetical protein Dda_1639 [Drechslerella dactyloides]